jgi:hypothetical protein
MAPFNMTFGSLCNIYKVSRRPLTSNDLAFHGKSVAFELNLSSTLIFPATNAPYSFVEPH